MKLIWKNLTKWDGVILFAVSFILAGMGSNSWADKTYIVKKGDSLYKISKRFKTDIGAITEVNGLASDKLALGTKLIIPSKRSVREESSPANSVVSENIKNKNISDDLSKFNANPQLSGRTEPRTHEVREGDSLWRIAKKYSITVNETKKT